MQSVPITTKFVSSNPAHGEVYSIQHYVIKFVSDMMKAAISVTCDRSVVFSEIKFVSDLRQVGGFLWVLTVSSTNKSDGHDIAEILLNVTLHTINHSIKRSILL